MNNNDYLTKQDLKELLEKAIENSKELEYMGCGDWTRVKVNQSKIVFKLCELLGEENED